jgi:hypothetical protein
VQGTGRLLVDTSTWDEEVDSWFGPPVQPAVERSQPGAS